MQPSSMQGIHDVLLFAGIPKSKRSGCTHTSDFATKSICVYEHACTHVRRRVVTDLSIPFLLPHFGCGIFFSLTPCPPSPPVYPLLPSPPFSSAARPRCRDHACIHEALRRAPPSFLPSCARDLVRRAPKIGALGAGSWRFMTWRRAYKLYWGLRCLGLGLLFFLTRTKYNG